MNVSLSGEKLSVRAGRSKFNLVTLPAAEFPVVEDIKAGQIFFKPRCNTCRVECKYSLHMTFRFYS